MSFFDTVKSVVGINSGVEAENIRKIILNIRVPRTVASIVIGGILAIAGLTSSCVGAALGIVLGWSTLHIQFLAFALGVMNICLIFLLSSRIKLDKTLWRNGIDDVRGASNLWQNR